MSYELKMKGRGNGRKSRLYKKTKRASMNRMDASHLPMRIQSEKNGYWGQTSRGRGQFSYKEVRGFLMARVGRPVNDVFSEFVVEMKKHEQNESIKETFDYFFDYEEEKMNGYPWASGFYVTNGILNYKKYSIKKQAFFDATKFMEKDVEIGLNKRDAIIQLEIVLDRYEYLFGPLADTTAVSKVLPEWKSKLV